MKKGFPLCGNPFKKHKILLLTNIILYDIIIIAGATAYTNVFVLIAPTEQAINL